MNLDETSIDFESGTVVDGDGGYDLFSLPEEVAVELLRRWWRRVGARKERELTILARRRDGIRLVWNSAPEPAGEPQDAPTPEPLPEAP